MASTLAPPEPWKKLVASPRFIPRQECVHFAAVAPAVIMTPLKGERSPQQNSKTRCYAGANYSLGGRLYTVVVNSFSEKVSSSV